MKKSIDSILQVLKKLDYILDRKQKKGAVVLLLALVVSSILELLGITAILPFVQTILEPNEMMKKWYIQFINRFFGIDGTRDMMLFLGMGLILVYVFKNVALIFASYIQYDYATRIQKELSVKMLSSYMSRPYTFFTENNSSEIIRGCSGDIASVYSIISYGTDVISQCLTVLVIGIYLIYQDYIMAISISAFMLLMVLFIIFVFKPIIKRLGKENLRVNTMTTKFLYQAIVGIKEIMVMQRQDLFLSKYTDASDQNRKISRKYNVLNVCPDRIIEAVCVGGIIGVVCIRLLNSHDNMASFVPTLATFALGSFKMLPSIGKIASRINVVVFSIPGLENVYNNLHEVNEYEKNMGEIRVSEDMDVLFKESLCISNVSWIYPKGQNWVLKDVSFTVNKGEAIGLIGASGAGKSTLADIILGLIHPQKGSVKVDGVDIYSNPHSWANMISYVPQTVYLIDDSIRNNVAFGIREENIDDKLVWAALEKAQLMDYVASLTEGIDTLVGERGVRFSGGQRQRIAIARALYNQPEILVMDEATASLDNDTENAVMEAIEHLQGQITMIIIAHRLTTIRNCDKIYEITDGVAVEREKVEILGNI